jgi:hypothetical protein
MQAGNGVVGEFARLERADRRQTMSEDQASRPLGFTAMGLFFVFGATMAADAAITLLDPGTVLDGLWALNKAGHARLAGLGKMAGLGFVVLSATLASASVGWFRRRYWGWVLGTTIIAITAAGDLVNLVIGERWKGAVGVVIAPLVLVYMTRDGVRSYVGARGEIENKDIAR